MRVATRLRDSAPITPADETERQIAAELLFEAGRHADLVELVRGTADANHAVRLGEDFARRLDRLCRAFLVEPADALLRASPPLYRFE